MRTWRKRAAGTTEVDLADADGPGEEEIDTVVDKSTERSTRGEEVDEEIQTPSGEKSGADVNEDEGEESSDDEEYSHFRVLLETRDRVLGRRPQED